MYSLKFLFLFIATILVLFYTISPRAYYSESDPVLDEIKDRFKRLKPEYSKIPMRIGERSFTEDKSVISLCTTDPVSKEAYDIDILMHVALHELAHVITKEDDGEHGTNFKRNFAMLLKEARSKELYDSRKTVPKSYCGHQES